MPFSMNSPLAQRLYYDLEMLSRATFETLQLVPMSSVCSTLLYGVAVTLRVGLGSSIEQHHENLLLSESLFKMLGEKDCALLVVATCPIDESSRNEMIDQGLFHSASLQHFLLTPEFIESNSGKVSNKGVLYRIASADYLLESNSAVDVMRASNQSSMDQMGANPYEEFVEASLDSVICAPLNPLSVKTHAIDPVTWTRDQRRVTWTNDVVEKQVFQNSEHTKFQTKMKPRPIDNDSDVLTFEAPTANESPNKQDDIDGPEDGDGLSEDELKPTNGKHSIIKNIDKEKVIEKEEIEKDDIDDSDDSSEPKRRPTEIPLTKHTISSSQKEDSEMEWKDSSSDSSTDDSDESSVFCTFEYSSH
jgi:hypothetical protein